MLEQGEGCEVRGNSGCPICLNNAKLTKEDWLPNWVRKILLSDRPPQGEYPPRAIARVCQPCNHGMGQVFENPTSLIMRPMFLRQEAVLSEQEQKVIAAWIVKTNLVRAVATEYGQRIFTSAVKEFLRSALMRMVETGMPPPNASVRVGCFLPPVLSGADTPKVEADYFGIPSRYREVESFTAVTHANSLAWETVIDGPMSSDRPQGTTRLDAPLAPLVRIWPHPVSELRWPPNVLLNANDYGHLCAAWGHPPENYSSALNY